MKLTLEFIETAEGNMEFKAWSDPAGKPPTAKETMYTKLTLACIKNAVPLIGEQLGAKTHVFLKGDPQKQ